MDALAERAVPLGARLRGRARAEWLLVGIVVGVAVYLALVPLGFLAWQTFFADGSLTLDAVRDAYDTFGLSGLAANSVAFAAASTALGVALGTALAYVVVRTDAPWKPFLFAAALIPIAVPGVLYTIAWIFLASPRTGTLNTLLEPLAGPRAFNVFSLGGMVLVEALRLAPLVFLLMYAAFRSLDPALEESALVGGARTRSVLRRVTLPVVLPALSAAVLVAAVRALEAFEVPALLGIPAGIWVFTSRIWRAVGEYPANLGEAGAYALPLLALTALGVLLHGRLTRRGRRFETVTGKGFRPRPIPLGRWRWPVLGLVVAYFLVSFVLPMLALLYVSTQPYYASVSGESLSRATLDNYTAVLTDGSVLEALKNSLVLAAGTATAVMAVMAVCAWLVLRTRLPGRRLLDHVTFVPIAVPGLVLGVSLLFVYLRVPIPVYGTLWILFIAYVTNGMPYGMRYASVSMSQIGKELEESAAVSGAGWLQSFRRVLLPLLAPGLLAGWIYILVISLRELSSSLILYSPGTEVLPVVVWERFQNGEFPEVATLGVLMTVVLVALVVAAHRLSSRVGVRAS
jgi:iron(III) transport system permease protein